MAQLLGIRIKNYKSLGDVTLGQIEFRTKQQPLPALACFIGANGCGKSTLLDAFGFLSDCLSVGVEAACDAEQRGGFDRLRTQGASDAIELIIYYRAHADDRPVRYELAIDTHGGRPVVARELLLQSRVGEVVGKLKTFLKLERGEGFAYAGESLEGERGRRRLRLSDPTQLGIATLGTLSDHPRIVSLRNYIQGWFLSYFVPDAARQLPPSGAQPHLDREGRNVGNVLREVLRPRSEPLLFPRQVPRPGHRAIHLAGRLRFRRPQPPAEPAPLLLRPGEPAAVR